MNNIHCHTEIVESEDATAAFTQRLAASAALDNAVIHLQGNLGAGKTTFTRHLLRALGVQGRIKSPTYAVVESYDLPRPPHWPGPATQARILHFDLYRFNDPQEWEDAGFRELFASAGLKLVEWPDKAHGIMPPPDLILSLDIMNNDNRRLQLQALSDRGLRLLEAVRP